MKFRVTDYIIVFVLAVIFYTIKLPRPITTNGVLGVLLGSLIPTFAVGTLTNLLIRKRQ